MPYQPRENDPLHIPKPEKGWHYRWLADDPERLSGHLLAHGDKPGYTLVRGKTLGDTKKIANEIGLNEAYVHDATGTIRYGRLILGKIPAAEAARRTQEHIDDYNDRRQALEDEFYEAANRRGVRPFVKEIDEIQDRARFAREDKVSVSLSGPNEQAGSTTEGS